MKDFINTTLQIGNLQLSHRLIQGPLAGYSCSPFRLMFRHFSEPAYSVSEMCSAKDVLTKHAANSRYLHRSPEENLLAYQLSGTDPVIMANAAKKLQDLGANLIDINCGCPKTKIRKKGAGSALLERGDALCHLIETIKNNISIPLTVKIRLQKSVADLSLARDLEQAGADALIVHGRTWMEDYDIPCDFEQIGLIKGNLKIPVIANGDISDSESLQSAIKTSGCDGFMIARAGCGQPWLYQNLLSGQRFNPTWEQRLALLMEHLHKLARLEDEYKAVLQSKSLVRYYFRNKLPDSALQTFYSYTKLHEIEVFLDELLFK